MSASAYAAAFAEGADSLAEGEAFLLYYSKNAATGALDVKPTTRAEFYRLALGAAHVLQSHGVAKGSYIAHYFSANHPLDLVYRLAAALLGAVPVTVNWQADTYERILYVVIMCCPGTFRPRGACVRANVRVRACVARWEPARRGT